MNTISIPSLALSCLFFIMPGLSRAENVCNAVILTATPSGWHQNSGKAYVEKKYKNITIINDAGSLVETYEGVLTKNKWIGTRTVNASDNIKEPLSGKLSSIKIGSEKLVTLIITNNWVSANFVCVE